ncbi:MAG: hypothetical protein KF874_09315 [Rhizobiaceae bacterium]|nr:hypothetical protein [Rhizobiaceae bacterium]
MDVIEKAIRNAFEKGDSSDQAFRERVYRQAFSALDRVLQANPGVTVEAAIKRRKSLQAKIVEIEQEFVNPRPKPAEDPLLAQVPPLPTGESQTVVHQPEPVVVAAPVAEEPPIVQHEPVATYVEPEPEPENVPVNVYVEPVATPHTHQVEHTAPEISPQTYETERSAPSIDPVMPVSGQRTAAPSAADGLTAERVVHVKERRRRPMAAMFVAVTLFSILAIGIWWAMQTGLLGNTTQSETITSIPVQDDDYEPGADEAPVTPGQADANRNWIPVFNASDSGAISAPSDATAEVLQDEGVSFVRVRSGGSGAAVLIDVNPGVLEQIAGKRATFDIVAKAQEGQDTQMSVTCNFGELGDCGRKRYAVGIGRADYLFEINIPDKKPGAAGTIAINSDFDNEGKSVDIYEIKVSVAE